MEDLAAANCIENIRLIYEGQTLYVPPGVMPSDQIDEGDIASEGCHDSNTLITYPEAGMGIDGTVIIKGVSQGPGFSRSVVEWKPDIPGQAYYILAVKHEPTNGGELARLNTNLFTRGLYWFRLSTLDASNNAIGQCAVRVRFL